MATIKTAHSRARINPKPRARTVTVPPDHRLWANGLTYAFKDVPDNYHLHKQKIARVRDDEKGIDWAGGDMSADGHRIGELAPGVEPSDAVNKSQLDELSSGGAMDLAGLRPGADITNSFQDVIGYTAESLPGLNVTFTLNTGQFALQVAGRWRIDFTFNITFTPDAAVRTTQLRVWNVTDGVAVGSPIPMIIEANDTGLDRMRFALFDLPEADVGDSFVMQIGGASTLAGVTWFDHTLALGRA